MKHLTGKRLWPCTILLLALLSPPASINQVVNAQTARQWPTRWQAGDTPADLTLARTLGLTSRDERGEVVGMGDFNGDRISDVLVSYVKAVPISEDRLTDRVVRYGIFFGKSAQSVPASINIDKQTPDLTLDLDYNLIGFILPAGDVNGDHIDDLMLVERVGEFGLGGARILYGSARPQSGRLDVTRQTPDLRILNPTPSFFPIDLRVADLNGDGINDLMLPAFGSDTSISFHGFLGPFAPGRTLDLGSQQADLLISAASWSGAQVLGVADVNGDGKADVLVGRRTQPAQPPRISPATLDIVFGREDLPLSRPISLTDGEADASFDLGFANGFATGDVNGDGRADLLVGHTLAISAGATAAGSYIDVVFGSPTLHGQTNHIDATISGLPVLNSSAVVSQFDLSSRVGAPFLARDLNGDGFADVVIGTLGVEDSDTEETLSPGRAHVIFGAANFASVHIEKEEQDVSIIFGKRQRSSGSPVNVGDFNGDGTPDVLVYGIDVSIFFGGPLRAPSVTTAKYKSKTGELTISGEDFNGAARVEINGVVVDRPVIFDAAEDVLVLQGTPAELNLRDGRNEVVVLRKGARSNAVKIKVK